MQCPTCFLPNVRPLDELRQLQCGHIFCKNCLSNQQFCLDPQCDETTDLFYQKTTETPKANSDKPTDTATTRLCTPMLWPSHVAEDKENFYTLDCCKRTVCTEHAAKLISAAMGVEKYDANRIATTCPECNPVLREGMKKLSVQTDGVGRAIAGRFGTVLFDALDLHNQQRQDAEDAYEASQLALYTGSWTLIGARPRPSTTPNRVNSFDKDAKCDGFACDSRGAWLLPNCGHRSCRICLKAVIKVAEYHILQAPFCPEEYCYSTLDDEAINYATDS